MGANRKAKADDFSMVFKLLTLFTKRMAEKHLLEKFKPDLTVEDGFDLGGYGLNAKVVHIPGHSKGSIGVLMDNGDLFCGDMYYNMPGFLFVDDTKDHQASVKKLESLSVRKVYPGHGKPFLPRSEQ